MLKFRKYTKNKKKIIKKANSSDNIDLNQNIFNNTVNTLLSEAEIKLFTTMYDNFDGGDQEIEKIQILHIVKFWIIMMNNIQKKIYIVW